MAFEEKARREVTDGPRLFVIEGDDPTGAGKPEFRYWMEIPGLDFNPGESYQGFLPIDFAQTQSAACADRGFSKSAVGQIHDAIAELMEMSQPDF